MTDARRTDPNYGHFGEPVYDTRSQDWYFARNLQDGTSCLTAAWSYRNN